MRRLALTFSIVSLVITGFVAPASAKSTTLARVTVLGNLGDKPTVKFSVPLSAATSVHRVVIPGTGAPLTAGMKTLIDFVLIDGRTGKELDSSFGAVAQALVLDKKQSPEGLVNTVLGSSVGSRILAAISPKDGLTAGLIKSGISGVKKNDTLVFVLDVKSTRTPLLRAAGTAVAPQAGLPTVQLAANGKPTITVPMSAAPAALVAQPLITGAGAPVMSGQTVTVHYSGVIWASGKQFDASWDRGAPIDFVIGKGFVIPGWDQALIGQTVGSQVLLVVPPSLGYGSNGNSSAGISGTDTLVFVVDILDVY